MNWRDEVIEFALDHETRKHMQEQAEWLEREPSNPKPYYHLAQFYRIAGVRDKALGLLLEAVRLDPDFGDAHAALSECYIVLADYGAAWRHARAAQRQGIADAVGLLERYGVPE